MDGPGFEFRWRQEIFSAGSGTHPASYSEGPWGFRWGLKQPGRDVYRQPPYSAADKNEWRCTSLNTVYLHVVHMESIFGKENREACHITTYVDSQHVST